MYEMGFCIRLTRRIHSRFNLPIIMWLWILSIAYLFNRKNQNHHNLILFACLNCSFFSIMISTMMYFDWFLCGGNFFLMLSVVNFIFNDSFEVPMEKRTERTRYNRLKCCWSEWDFRSHSFTHFKFNCATSTVQSMITKISDFVAKKNTQLKEQKIIISNVRVKTKNPTNPTTWRKNSTPVRNKFAVSF